MITCLKVISLLLSYPTEEIRNEMPALKQALIKDGWVGQKGIQLLGKLADAITDGEIYDAQERYVYLFDRTRSLSLHLFEHVHGESRDRGQAMVDLKQTYEAAGFELKTSELPDFLPLFLEFLSVRPEKEAREFLSQISHIVSAIRKRLKKRNSVYATAFTVLEAIAQGKPQKELVDEILAVPDDNPDDLESLDQIWEEEIVTFGGNAGENKCGLDRIRTLLRAADRRPDDQSGTSNGAEA